MKGPVAVAVRKSIYDGASWSRQMAFRSGWVYVGLPSWPARYKNPSNVEHYVAYPYGMYYDDLAKLGNLAAKMTQIPVDYAIPLLDAEGPQEWANVDHRKLRPLVRRFLHTTEPHLVLYGDEGWPEGDQFSPQAILDANGAPSWLLAADKIPATWTQVGE